MLYVNAAKKRSYHRETVRREILSTAALALEEAYNKACKIIGNDATR